ncbi:hypothetical protein D0Y60_20890 [Shinella sp. WSJ-2]|uniref:hypothetical protein n=1 Tax=Shinella sp. WSJ-2 TaxID=2303749 RepID=UPI000E3DF7F2|nr:hypothetical protein [Shinella sp. WSJ-2]RFZ83823.1 hypothetical protein D0Y60_20890 [Shinella sp. WSJ-2]
MQTLYAYQVSPGSDDTLFFALTVEECRAAAIAQRRELRIDTDSDEIGAMAMYECLLRVDLMSLLDILNFPEDGYRRLLVSKKMIGLVVD